MLQWFGAINADAKGLLSKIPLLMLLYYVTFNIIKAQNAMDHLRNFSL